MSQTNYFNILITFWTLQEKGELVDLILQTFSPQTNVSNSGEYVRRLDNYVNTARSDATSDGTGIESQSHPENENETNISNPRANDQIESISEINESFSQMNSNSNQTNTNVSEEGLIDSKEDKSKIYFNVDDIENVEQLKELSVKQLKLILTRNFIDYKGCVEKEELLSKAERLWTDRHENKLQSMSFFIISLRPLGSYCPQNSFLRISKNIL